MKRNDYVNDWVADCAYQVPIDSDLTASAIRWCKDNLESNEWYFKRSAFIRSSHTLCFENETDWLNFSTEVLA